MTPYNGSKSGNEAQSLIQLRKYELEMAKKYDFVTVADWYQVASKSFSIKEAIEKADKAPVKGGKK